MLRSGTKSAINILAAGIILIFLHGCNLPPEPFKLLPFSENYNKGLAALKQQDYPEAAEFFSAAYTQHPYSPLAPQAQLLVAFAKFAEEKYSEAIVELEIFLDLYPAHQQTPYALYLLGSSYYNQISIIERDSYNTEQSMQNYQRLVTAFPETEYALAAHYRLDLLANLLAAKQMDVGRFYLKRNNIAPAIARFATVVSDFQQTEQIREALYRMIESYLILGLEQEAITIGKILGHNYPDSIWYQRGYSLLQRETSVAKLPPAE